jgi:hypothetical protein
LAAGENPPMYSLSESAIVLGSSRSLPKVSGLVL